MADETVWLTIPVAAKRLGVTPQAIRNRINRGTLETQKNNRGQILVRVAPTVPSTVPATVGNRLASGDNPLQAIVERQLEQIADLREQVARLGGIDAARQQQVADLQAERDRLLALVERLTERQGPWWRRWWSGR